MKQIIELLNKVPEEIVATIFILFYIFGFIKLYRFLNNCEKEGK